LTQGYQLHVLSYTLHAILVTLAPVIELGALDFCLEDLISVVMDDIFGSVGQEKDNQDYISSMKEVKSSKSYDSMEHLARSTGVASLSKLVNPIQTILIGTLGSKQIRQVDELLRRLGAGVSQNPAASQRDILVFAYQLIQSIYKQKELSQPQAPTQSEKNRQRYLVQLMGANKTSTGQTSPLLYKLAKFALDLLRSTLQKHNDLLTPENIHGFLPVIGDALVEAQEDVKISALRLLAVIIRLPMPELDQNGLVYVMEAVKLVRSATNTNEEGAQAALKLISAFLRERKSVKVRDSDIAEILHRITPDIEEPDRQGVTFNFIRAVMARKIQLPELYELVDKIAIMMVTNQTRGARDVARGVYVHFLLEYPQASTRWSKQQKFLLKNLEYNYPEGRQSVMEAINSLLVKLKGNAADELISTLFIPVVLRMANDDNKNCRELAGALLGQIFLLADDQHLKEFLEPLKSWIDQSDNMELQKIGLQAYTVLLSAGRTVHSSELVHVRDDLVKTLRATANGDADMWEIQFQALVLLSKLVELHPEIVLNQKQNKLWEPVWTSLGHSNAWIQTTAAGLTKEFFRDCMSTDVSRLPLTCAHGLQLRADDFLAALKLSVRILRRTQGNEELSGQIVQTLIFLGQCADVNGLTMEVVDKSSGNEEEPSDDSDNDNDDGDIDTVGSKRMKKIPAMQYLLDQAVRILRLEISTLTSAALLPKTSSMNLLIALLPALSNKNTNRKTIQSILTPLQHLTDTNTIAPQSADPAFAKTYQSLIELAHEVMQVIQSKIGDVAYVQAMTEVSKMVRKRREERRTKRRIDRVAEPEKAARDKKRKGDRKKERNREIARTHMKRRREV
jgi:U3 small nucleolar RNA-associated protein 20